MYIYIYIFLPEKNATKVIKLHMQQRPLPRSNEVRYRKMLFKLSVHSNDSFDDHLSQSKSPQKSKKGKNIIRICVTSKLKRKIYTKTVFLPKLK